MRLSVRARVLASVLAMSALGMVVTGVTAFLIQDRFVDAGITVALQQEVDEFHRLESSGVDPQTGVAFASVEHLLRYAIEGNVPHRNETYLALLNERVIAHGGGNRPLNLEAEPAVLAALAAVSHSPAVTFRDVPTAAGRVRLAIVPVSLSTDESAGTYVMAFAIDRGRDDLVPVALIYLLASLGSLIIVGVVGWLVAGRLLRPLQRLRGISQRIGESDLAERIPVHGNDDVSELARTYNQMLDRLQTAMTAQRGVLDDAGHELRTPLTILRGHLEVLDATDPLDVQETRALLLDETDRMARLVEDLMLLSKSQRPDFLVHSAIDLATFTTDVLDKARALGEREWRLQACGAGTFHGDPHRLTQAILELAGNAVKFSDPGSVISIGSSADDEAIWLWVSDAGAGIGTSEMDQVFERFWRAPAIRALDGSGLGLSIVETIAQAHRGRVVVDSQLGQGSTFAIMLPQSASASEFSRHGSHRATRPHPWLRGTGTNWDETGGGRQP